MLTRKVEKGIYIEIDSSTEFNEDNFIPIIAQNCLKDAIDKRSEKKWYKVKMTINNLMIYFELLGQMVLFFYSFFPVLFLANYLELYDITYASSFTF